MPKDISKTSKRRNASIERQKTSKVEVESIDTILSESPMQRLEKIRQNRTKSLENPPHDVSQNSNNESSTKKSLIRRKRSPTGKLLFSRRVPAAALSAEEYRLKRGLASRNLPPMSESPKTDARKAVQQMFEATRKASITGKPKPKQLAPIDNFEFDYYKHRRRMNKKLPEQTD